MITRLPRDPVTLISLSELPSSTPGRSARECPYGWSRYLDDEHKHVQKHFEWGHGITVPNTLKPRWQWGLGIAVVHGTSPTPWRRLPYGMAKLAQREGGYDVPTVPDPFAGRPWDGSDRPRMVLYRHDDRVRGFACLTDAPTIGRLLPSEEFAEISDGPVRANIALIWVAYHWRGQGVGAALVRAAAYHANAVVTDMSWSVPFTESGRALAAKVNPDGSWLA